MRRSVCRSACLTEFLGLLPKLLMPVRMEQVGSHWKNLREILVLEYLSKFCLEN